MDREEQIKARAHAIWEQEGRPEARSQEHWERAERDVDSDAAMQGGNEETGAGLFTNAHSEEEASSAESGTTAGDEDQLEDSAEGSAQLHEDVTGSPQMAPLGKNSAE